jgi:hypothetical protein
VKTVFFVWFFLVNGVWTPASEFEGWAVREAGQGFEKHEYDKKLLTCEFGQELAKETNKRIQANPDGADMPGVPHKVHGAYVACIPVEFPQ